LLEGDQRIIDAIQTRELGKLAVASGPEARTVSLEKE
jgi:hypothetical protein